MRDRFLRLLVLAIGCASAGSSADADLPQLPAVDFARLKARTVCSCLFVQRMTFEQCGDGSSAIWRFASAAARPPLLESPMQRLEVELETGARIVRFRDGRRVLSQSRYLPDGGGCVTLPSDADLDATDAATSPPSTAARGDSQPLLRGPLPADSDAQALSHALDEGFSPDGPMRGFTRAVIVVANDRVVADRYAPGFGAHNQYYLGSVAKVFNNLLAGLLVRDGRLRVNDTVPVPEWSSRGDARSRITYDHLLKMASGLGWDEEFFVVGAPGYSVYFEGSASLDVASYMRSRPLEAKPGTHFEYSTGSATLLASLLQAKLDTPGRESVLRYFERELFAPIGAQQITPEFDAAGTFLSGHAVFAGAEDLARVGMLLLHDGRAHGRRVLPEGWVDYSTRPALAASSGYGAQLRTGMLDLPGCFGHGGVGQQFLVVCPARRLVIAWLSSAFNFTGEQPAEPDELVRKIVRAFPERSAGVADASAAE